VTRVRIFQIVVGVTCAVIGVYWLGIINHFWANFLGLPVPSNWFFVALTVVTFIPDLVGWVVHARDRKNHS
jgi:hypothetical protein